MIQKVLLVLFFASLIRVSMLAYWQKKLSEKYALQGEFIYTYLGRKDTYNLTTMVGNEVLEIRAKTTKITNSGFNLRKLLFNSAILFVCGIKFWNLHLLQY